MYVQLESTAKRGQIDSIWKESDIRTGHQATEAAAARASSRLPDSTFSFSARETWARNLAVVEVWVLGCMFLFAFFCF
jgi:hypothetical protein